MNAVLERPPAKAKPKAEKSALQARLDKIFANLKLGQEKLQLAHQSVGLTDPGEAAEVLLRSVIEDMLPPASRRCTASPSLGPMPMKPTPACSRRSPLSTA